MKNKRSGKGYNKKGMPVKGEGKDSGKSLVEKKTGVKIDRSMKNRKLVWGLLFLILVLATFLRFWGIKFGLPHIYYIDSTKIVKRAKLIDHKVLIQGKWDIDPEYYQYPTLFTNLLALEYAVYAYAYGIITTRSGEFKSIKEAMASLFEEKREYLYEAYPPAFYLLARINNAIAGILTVLLCFFLARLAFDNDDRVGLLAAFFLAVMFLHVKHSKYPMADTVLTFWTVLAMFYVVKIFITGRRRDYLLSGLFIGLGTSTKYLTIFLAASYLLNVFVKWHENRQDSIIARKVIIFALIGLLMIPVGFLIGTPTFLTRHNNFLNKVKSEHKGMGNPASGGKYGNTQRGFFDYFFNTMPSWFEPYTMNSLWGAMGIPLLILVTFAFFYFIYKGVDKDTEDKTIYWDFLLFVSIFYGFFAGKGKNRIIRYFVLVAPFLTVIAGKFFVDIMDKIPYGWVKAKKAALIGGLALLIVLPTIVRSVQYNSLMTHTNNRVTAGKWIEQNIPVGSRLLMPILYPPCVSALRYRIRYYRGQQKNSSMVPTYKYLKQADLDYFILSSYDYGPSFSEEALRDYPDGTLAFRKLYQDLEDKAEWKKVFESNLKDAPGPIIRIYKI